MSDYCWHLIGLLFPVTDHRLFSPHVHQPLSRPPTDGRRKRVNEGRKDGRRGQTPAATTEEDQEAKDESCSDEEGGRAAGSRWVTNLSCCEQKSLCIFSFACCLIPATGTRPTSQPITAVVLFAMSVTLTRPRRWTLSTLMASRVSQNNKSFIWTVPCMLLSPRANRSDSLFVRHKLISECSPLKSFKCIPCCVVLWWASQHNTQYLVKWPTWPKWEKRSCDLWNITGLADSFSGT